jgi:hypothetical protein
MRRQALARRHTHRPKALVKCQRCRNDGRNAAIDMHGHAANETNIADASNETNTADSSNQTAEYSSCEMDIYNRSRTSEGGSLSLISNGRTYHRVDYRVQTLVRTSASTADNSASNCVDDTNTGSGDRSASPPMCAGVRVVVLARVLSSKCRSDCAIRAMPELCCSDRNTRMVAVPVYAEQPRCFEATILDETHSRIWTMANLWSTIQAKNGAVPSRRCG